MECEEMNNANEDPLTAAEIKNEPEDVKTEIMTVVEFVGINGHELIKDETCSDGDPACISSNGDSIQKTIGITLQITQSTNSSSQSISNQSPADSNQLQTKQVAINSVESLLKKPFSRRLLEEKMKIKELGRPTPDLNINQKASGRSGYVYNRRFNRSTYDTYNWICGCDIRNALFCFPCLLFEKKPDTFGWTRTGIRDLGHFKAISKKHNDHKVHINNVLNLITFGAVNIETQLSRAYYNSLREQSEKVQKNRYMLSRIIDCIKFFGAFELALRGQDDMSENPGVFLGLVDFVSSLDSAVKLRMGSNNIFQETSKEIQNELLDSMLQVCRQKIAEEIKAAEFVAVMVDEATDISEQMQLVVMFRYEKNGIPYERFWGFFSPEKQDVEEISTCILNVIDEIFKHEPHKIIGLTYGGICVKNGGTGGVASKIKHHYPRAQYIHCYAHELNLVVEQAASRNNGARVFFCNLSAFPCFFSKSPQLLSSLNAVISSKNSSSSVESSHLKSKTVDVVHAHKGSLIECLLSLEESSSSPRTVQEAAGLRLYLESDEFLFWLNFFGKIMPYVEVLKCVLRSRFTDAHKIKIGITNFTKAVEEVTESLDNVDCDITSQNKERKNCQYIAAKQVCEQIVEEVNHRFQYLNHLEAAKLINCMNFNLYSKRFPQEELDSAVETYGMLDKNRLQTELSVLYARTDYRRIDGAVPLLQVIVNNKLQETFCELTKLLRIIVTIPMTTVEPDRCYSSLKRVKTFLRNTMSQERLTALAMLSIEKEMVAGLEGFNTKVIDIFSNQEQRRKDFSLHD